ncbi:MAG TPA: hypothetical protein ENJ79_03740 [Gammaproteobacteria bacterium]|nr:hypothetical protein [Gammaproteobacteria bacterium]
MPDTEPDIEKTNNEEPERISPMQIVLDNPYLLLFIGVVVPTVFYIIWGIMELLSIPVAQ